MSVGRLIGEGPWVLKRERGWEINIFQHGRRHAKPLQFQISAECTVHAFLGNLYSPGSSSLVGVSSSAGRITQLGRASRLSGLFGTGISLVNEATLG